MSYRDEIKRPARRALHEKSKVPALYLASPAGTPVPVGVRVHTKFAPQGSLTGAGAGWADRQDTQPKLIFQRSEMQPAQGAFVSVALGEAYQISSVLPPDDEFVSAVVVILSASQIEKTWPTGQPVPE